MRKKITCVTIVEVLMKPEHCFLLLVEFPVIDTDQEKRGYVPERVCWLLYDLSIFGYLDLLSVDIQIQNFHWN